jgi:hypothetical protein
MLIVMDSQSPEEVAYVKKHIKDLPEVKLITFHHEKFSHPYSVNLGLAAANEELVCITNGHALPISLQWLEDGLIHFEDENVAGVGGFFYPSDTLALRPPLDLIQAQMAKIAGVYSRFSTINCIIRRSRWREYPFDEALPKVIPETKKFGGEDYDWPLEMISRGYKIVLDPNFSVIHTHRENLAIEILRNLKNYFIYNRLHGKIKSLQRPRDASISV